MSLNCETKNKRITPGIITKRALIKFETNDWREGITKQTVMKKAAEVGWSRSQLDEAASGAGRTEGLNGCPAKNENRLFIDEFTDCCVR